jgi:hypothetical protein
MILPGSVRSFESPFARGSIGVIRNGFQALELKLEATQTGAIMISGTLRYSLGPTAPLFFTLECDQANLKSIASALEAVMDRFPIRP